MLLAACASQIDDTGYVVSTPSIVSGGEGQPDILVTRSCGPRFMSGYEKYDRRTFRMSEDSRGTLAWLSEDKREVVSVSFPIFTRSSCYANIQFEQEVSLSPIPKTQWGFLPEEADAYAQTYQRCETKGSLVNRFYPRVILASNQLRGGAPFGVVITDVGIRISDSIDGCSHVVPAYTQGFIVSADSAKWRIFISFENVIINRIQ
jgi:hypothetical protein